MAFLWATLLVVAVLCCWFLNFLGMPGNWLAVASAAIYAWLLPAEGRAAIGWPVVGVAVGLATLGEIVEMAASAAGVKKMGGSRRGAVLALGGSIVGALVGMFVGVPVPIFGSLLAALLFGGLGALGGAMLGETWKGRDFDSSWQVGKAAFWGRLLGTFAKAIIGALIVALVIAALLVA